MLVRNFLHLSARASSTCALGDWQSASLNTRLRHNSDNWTQSKLNLPRRKSLKNYFSKSRASREHATTATATATKLCAKSIVSHQSSFWQAWRPRASRQARSPIWPLKPNALLLLLLFHSATKQQHTSFRTPLGPTNSQRHTQNNCDARLIHSHSSFP